MDDIIRQAALRGLDSEIERLGTELATLRRHRAALAGTAAEPTRTQTPAPKAAKKTRQMSPEGRARIAAATRARWERERAAKAAAEVDVARPPMPRHVKSGA